MDPTTGDGAAGGCPASTPRSAASIATACTRNFRAAVWTAAGAAVHTHLMAIQPFADTALNDNNGNATPDIEVVLAVVPVGKLLVVEHVSGRLAVRDGDTAVDFIQAAAQGQDSVVFLPVHFVSSVGQFSATQGLGRWHQFGSPARLYVQGGKSLVVSGGASKTVGSPDPNATISLFAAAIGYLVDE
jgi:hypothetical protein